MVLLAELIVRHTRRHMPTRRVALEGAYLPMSGSAHGATLLAAVVATHLPQIDEDTRELLPRLLDDAKAGLGIPRIALRHRLQRDVHGLDRSTHRILGEDGHIVCEIDTHGAPAPQVLGAVMAAAGLPPSARATALAAIRQVVEGRWRGFAPGVVVRYVWDSQQVDFQPPLAGAGPRRQGRPPEEEVWQGVDADQRWAMEVLGLRAGMSIRRGDINRRYRRLLSEAHPDHGGAHATAAARITELSEARTILLDIVSADVAAEA